jgi:hypothetical protein
MPVFRQQNAAIMKTAPKPAPSAAPATQVTFTVAATQPGTTNLNADASFLQGKASGQR